MLVGGRGLKGREHKLIVWTVHDKVGVYKYKKGWFGGPGVGATQVNNDACWVSHQGFYHDEISTS